MARGRRGRRSRSKQRSKGAGTRSSKAKSSKSRSKNTRGSGARKSAPKSRRNTTASNRRATASKKRQATRSAPKRAVNASRGKAPTSRRQATRVNRQSKPTTRSNLVASNKRINALTNPRGALKEADAARKGIRPEVKNPGFLDSILNRNNQLQQQINNLGSNVTNSAGTFANALMGINAANAQPNTRPKLLANLPKDYKQQEQALSAAADASRYKSLSIDQQREIQQGKYGETFGLNPITQRNEINRIRNMIKAQNAARVRQGLDPTFSGQSLKEARDADGDGYADNMGNRIASVYNATLGRLGLPNMPKQTVGDANISMNRPMGQRLPGLVKRRGSSGGASRIQQQAAAQAVQPEIAPTIGKGTPTPGSIIKGVIPRLGGNTRTPVGQVRSGASLPSIAEALQQQQQQQPVEELILPTNADLPNLQDIQQRAYNRQMRIYGAPNYMAQFRPTQRVRPLRRRQFFNRDYFTQFA